MIRRKFSAGLIACMLMLAPLVHAESTPDTLVANATQEILALLKEKKALYQSDKKNLYQMVDEKILPYFDFRKMSQSALGRFWRDASDAQKEAITNEFRQLLVRTYASALLGYSGQEIQYLPVQYRQGDNRVMVPTRISSQSAPPIPVNYRLTLNDARWMVYDVIIDGVSLITNYRSQFANEVRRGGIDGLISSLADMNGKVGK